MTANTVNHETVNEKVIDEASIQDWLIMHIAELTQLYVDEVDPEEPFAQYGLDSSVTASLTGELGDWMGCELELTLFWEYPNIQTLSEFLANEMSI